MSGCALTLSALYRSFCSCVHKDMQHHFYFSGRSGNGESRNALCVPRASASGKRLSLYGTCDALCKGFWMLLDGSQK